MSYGELLLVRHGRSAHVAPRLLRLEEFTRWREAYEAAGIDDGETAPPHLVDAAAAPDAFLLASDAPRAVASALAIRSEGPHDTTSLLRELTLKPPQWRGFPLPLAGWALLFVLRGVLSPTAHVTSEERTRVGEAAELLAESATRHATVIAVMHGSFRVLLSETLVQRGWRLQKPRRAHAHWSAWRLVR